MTNFDVVLVGDETIDTFPPQIHNDSYNYSLCFRSVGDAVYLHTGADHLMDYLSTDHRPGLPTWINLVDQHVSQARELASAHQVPVFVGGVLGCDFE